MYINSTCRSNALQWFGNVQLILRYFHCFKVSWRLFDTAVNSKNNKTNEEKNVSDRGKDFRFELGRSFDANERVAASFFAGVSFDVFSAVDRGQFSVSWTRES